MKISKKFWNCHEIKKIWLNFCVFNFGIFKTFCLFFNFLNFKGYAYIRSDKPFYNSGYPSLVIYVFKFWANLFSPILLLKKKRPMWSTNKRLRSQYARAIFLNSAIYPGTLKSPYFPSRHNSSNSSSICSRVS